MTPLEEQVEKLAREWEKDADVLEGLAPKGTWVNGASTARREDANQLRALLPLEVTDEMRDRAGVEVLRIETEDEPVDLRTKVDRILSAALTQPQTGRLAPDVNTPAQFKEFADGGGAAVAAGVADADLEGEGVYEAVYACLDACGGTMGSTALHFLADLDERGFRVVRATHESFTEEPGPYAKAFRERVCPVPEFPGIEKEES